MIGQKLSTKAAVHRGVTKDAHTQGTCDAVPLADSCGATRLAGQAGR